MSVTFGPVTDRPILSLADLEAHDPAAPDGGTERRFKCPLCTPQGRHLALNTTTGAWWCHRCLAYGLIRERWNHQPGQQAFRPAKKMPRSTLRPVAKPVDHEPEKWGWRAFWDTCEPITFTPGAAYLRGRGIDDELAYEAGVRYADRFEVAQVAGGASWKREERCILFPFHDRAGALVAVNIRFIDVPSSEQARKTVTLGKRSLGAFMPLAHLRRDPVVVVEGPIDALSMLMAGVPALALVGTAGTNWLPEACVLKNVAIALDSDERGDAGAERLRGLLTPVGARMARWRAEAKDWNDDLRAIGPDALRQRIEDLYARDFSVADSIEPMDDPQEAQPNIVNSIEPDDLYDDVDFGVPDDFDFDDDAGPASTMQARKIYGPGPCRTCQRDDAMIDHRGATPVCMFHKGSPD